MEYIIIAFRSRAETMRYNELLANYGMPREIISTPKEASIGCGLSVKIQSNNFSTARRLLMSGGFNSVAGVFEVKYYGSRRVIKPI